MQKQIAELKQSQHVERSDLLLEMRERQDRLERQFHASRSSAP